MKILVTDIEWDIDDDDEVYPNSSEHPEILDGVLPSKMTFETDEEFVDEDDMVDWIGNKISEETGFYQTGFYYDIIKA